ncbi:bifunctional folylpolyglutamate synthase/dihydrofolate synthase [Geminocystis herdmanii]|uniref:bifunctional folylpolyglutamate synthase/dihydrofolate synthase n=1 Tax=Geminocystis herdmanii TaxID=669359 RepID=UPI0003461F08|nr:folylpolyglutamate synthase/dihydrofolate synthase family protein [Geminocystis herdmanii]
MTNNQRKTELDILLEPYQKFGISLGLERIKNLLNVLGNPQEKVSIIHVAGTNGKGSVCAYLSSILTQAGYNTGRYTSPHLVHWNERICLNEKPISTEKLIAIIKHISTVIDSLEECPTLFEVITASAWVYFAECQVDVAVMEVGLGGRLDATNVCDRNLVSIITSISREHWQRLGNTLTEIATEKAGVIKAQCPVIVGNLPEEANIVVRNRAKILDCPTIWAESAEKFSKNGENWAKYQDIEYPLPLAGDIQLHNSAISIETIKILQAQGWHIKLEHIQEGMRKAKWRGRIEWVTWQGQKMLIDGAHNVASAQILRQYVDTLNKPIIWVMGMLSTKDHQGIFEALLRPQDQLHLVPVPDHSSTDTEFLSQLAQNVNPLLTKVNTYEDLFIALEKVSSIVDNEKEIIVLCGSLYLLGYFLQHFSQ